MRPSSMRKVGGWLLLLGALSAGCAAERPPPLPYEPSNLPDPRRPTFIRDAGSAVRPELVDAGSQRDSSSSTPGALSGLVGEVRTPAVAPPAISGGTLLVARDGRTAVAADPERDRVCFVDLTGSAAFGCVSLEAGDEPGRLVEDGAGLVHVALRRGGAVVSIDRHRAVVSRRAVCPAPRGIAHDPATGLLHVACAGGELVSLLAAGGPETRRLRLDRDLRDVVVRGEGLVVSRFRSAELLTLAADGTVTRRARPADVAEAQLGGESTTIGGRAGVAWRTVPRGDGVLVLHQRALTTAVRLGPGGYGGDFTSRCPTGVVQGALTQVGAAAPTGTPTLAGTALAVDVAVSSDGERMVVAVAGNSRLARTMQVLSFGSGALSTPAPGGCATGESVPIVDGQVVAVAMTPDDRVVAQTREPAAVVLPGGRIVRLGGDSREDTGHSLFHANAGGFVACASCHPEGGDDGHVWNFSPIGARRTQNLHGGLAGTAPFHWDGDMPTFARLAADVFGQRMNGGGLRHEQVDALERWSTGRPSIPKGPPGDPDAVARGRAVFDEPTVGCTTCHGGANLTNNVNVDVGTGGSFQVPSLRGVVWRTPLMHNGCAPTLRDRFGGCGGGDRHGHTSQLLPAQIDDLVAYLETL